MELLSSSVYARRNYKLVEGSHTPLLETSKITGNEGEREWHKHNRDRKNSLKRENKKIHHPPHFASSVFYIPIPLKCFSFYCLSCIYSLMNLLFSIFICFLPKNVGGCLADDEPGSRSEYLCFWGKKWISLGVSETAPTCRVMVPTFHLLKTQSWPSIMEDRGHAPPWCLSDSLSLDRINSHMFIYYLNCVTRAWLGLARVMGPTTRWWAYGYYLLRAE